MLHKENDCLSRFETASFIFLSFYFIALHNEIKLPAAILSTLAIRPLASLFHKYGAYIIYTIHYICTLTLKRQSDKLDESLFHKTIIIRVSRNITNMK